MRADVENLLRESVVEAPPARVWLRDRFSAFRLGAIFYERAYGAFKRMCNALPSRGSTGRLAEVISIAGVTMQLNPSSGADRHLRKLALRGRLYEPGTTRVVRALLQNGDTFIDVGANAGYFSLVAAKRVGNAGRVLSIEPYEPTLNRLKKNAELSEVASIISPHLIAASDKAGVAMLHVSLRNDGENSIFADVGLPVACKTGTVDQLVQHQPVHVIKIDAEGSEASVLSGMKETLNDNPEICLIIEWHPLYASSVLWKSLISRFTVYSIIESEVRFGLIPVESSLHVPRLRLSNLLCIPKHI